VNQVTSRIKRVRVEADGQYNLKLPAGAYRLRVEAPYAAKFDATKNYGEHALIRDNVLENVIVVDGNETKIDFEVEKKETKPVASAEERKPLGAADRTSVKSEPQTQP